MTFAPVMVQGRNITSTVWAQICDLGVAANNNALILLLCVCDQAVFTTIAEDAESLKHAERS